MSRIPPAVTAAVDMRADGRCEGCGRPALDDQLSYHHRRAHGMGGDRNRPGQETVENVIRLHHHCHTWAHAHANRLARDLGWIVSQYAEPSEVPVVVSSLPWRTIPR